MDFLFFPLLVAILTVLVAQSGRKGCQVGCLERRLRAMEQKLDALLKHEGIEPPPPPASGLSPEVERLAQDPKAKIAAIRLYRQENPGVGLAEAKAKIEEFSEGRR